MAEDFEELKSATDAILEQSERDLDAARNVSNRACLLQQNTQAQLLQVESNNLSEYFFADSVP